MKLSIKRRRERNDACLKVLLNYMHYSNFSKKKNVIANEIMGNFVFLSAERIKSKMRNTSVFCVRVNALEGIPLTLAR